MSLTRPNPYGDYSSQMILPIRYYGDPVLRQICKPIEKITPAVMSLADDMLETMYSVDGVGLAAPQVGHLITLAVIDVRASKRASTLLLDGEAAPLEALQPLALSEISIVNGAQSELAFEACLSIPGIRAEVLRAESIEVRGFDLHRGQVSFRCGGLLARAIQHEHDHLNGILFTDRMLPDVFASIRDQLQSMERETQRKLTQAG